MDQEHAEMVENRLISREYLQNRLMEPEVVQIDDYFSNVVLPPEVETLKSPEPAAEERMEQVFSGTQAVNRTADDQTNSLAVPVQKTNMHKPMLTFTSVKLDQPKPVMDKSVSIEAQLKQLIARSSIRKRPLCEIYIDDQVYSGTVEKLEHGMVYLKEAYARIWRQFQVDRIYRVKVL